MAPVQSRASCHEHDQERSSRNLLNARLKAKACWGYDYEDTRRKISEEFKNRNNNMEPYEWQLDVAEAIILGLDCTVIAGTGAGKTMPFVMPLFAVSQKIIIGVYPLNSLEEDQVFNIHRSNSPPKLIYYRPLGLRKWGYLLLWLMAKHTMRNYTRYVKTNSLML